MAKTGLTARLSADTAALLLIDHQSGIMQLVHDYSPAEFRNNIIALATLGQIFKLPTILTSSFEEGPNGPIIPQVLALNPDAPVIRRPGQINAWDNDEFVSAVAATGRSQLIMAGVTTDVCLTFPAIGAVEAGYQVFAVIDASGAQDLATQQMTIHRLSAAGVTCVNWVAVAAELQRDWRNETGMALGNLFHNHLLNYGMLIDSFALASKARER